MRELFSIVCFGVRIIWFITSIFVNASKPTYATLKILCDEKNYLLYVLLLLALYQKEDPLGKILDDPRVLFDA